MNKMKSLFPVFLGLFILLFMVACEDESDELGTEDLIGVWELVSMDNEMVIKSSIEQDAILLLSPGTGAIHVIGDLEEDLKYIFAMDFDAYQVVMVTNDMLGYGDLPSYTLMAYMGEGIPNMISLEVILEDMTEHYFDASDFIGMYDDLTATFTLQNIDLYNMDSSMVVRVGGNLQMTKVHIPANEKVEIPFWDELDSVFPMEMTLVLAEDGSIQIIQAVSESSIQDTTFGEWTVSGNDLIMTTDVDGETSEDVMQVDMDGGNMILSGHYSCADESSTSGCLLNMENMLMLEEGSLVSYSETQVMEFSPVGLAKRNQMREHSGVDYQKLRETVWTTRKNMEAKLRQ